MKTNLLFISALATLALSACNKQDDPTIDPNEGQPTLLTINLTGSSASKAVGAPAVGDETTIKTGMVFVFKGTGANPALDAKQSFDFTGSMLAPIAVNITQGVRQVYVVANVNTANFATINTLSDLQHATTKLSLANFRAGITGSLPMSGFVANVDASAGTLAAPTQVAVTLEFIGSRVHVDWDISNLNPGITGLTIDGAALLNVDAHSEYIATPNGSGGFNPLTHGLTNYLRGIQTLENPAGTVFTGSYLPHPATLTNIYDAELFTARANKGFTANYTYVFENSSPNPIIVAFKGTIGTTVYYWPIVINGTRNGILGANAGDQTASIKRGTIYHVKAVIKGLGVSDPYTPINPGAIEVTLNTASWNPVIQIDQEFN